MSSYTRSDHSDPTADQAIGNIMREYKAKQRQRNKDKNRRRVYVASAYAGDVKKNTRAAVRYCRYVIAKGYMPIASHLLYPRILNDNNPAERDLGLLFGLALLRLCDEVWVFGEKTPGVLQEIEEAKKLKKPIRYYSGKQEEAV